MIPDPLDTLVGGPRQPSTRSDRPGADEPKPGGRRRAQTTLALGLKPTALPGLVLLPLGVALGPQGLGLLSPTVLSYLDPAVSVGLATLGVYVGLGVEARRPHEGRLLAAASLEAALTMTIVGAGVLLVLRLVPLAAGFPPWLLALLLGIAAAASSTTAIDEIDGRREHAVRVGDLDDMLPIVLGGLALASMRESDPAAVLWLAAQSALVALIVGLAGWLLVAQSTSDSEQRVFTVGTLLLLGGAAEYLSLSALLSGFVAGVLWNAVGGVARERIGRDVRHVQHPLVVLLLLIAGARVAVGPGVAVLALAYLVCRIAGKMAGGWLAGRIAAPDLPAHLGLYLISPGVIAVAFALNVVQAGGPDRATLALTVVVAGSLASELLSLFVHPREASS
jgi:hypothetical protein